jgi:Fe-S-cluster containining protein
LPAPTLEVVKVRASEIQAGILESAPQLEAPYFLDALTEDVVDRIVEQAGSPRCPLLDERDECLIYEHRPLACRLEGLPMVDIEDGPFSDWCELNFSEGLTEADIENLGFDYHTLQELEDLVTEALSESTLGRRSADITLFIPSLVVQTEGFWKLLFQKATT